MTKIMNRWVYGYATALCDCPTSKVILPEICKFSKKKVQLTFQHRWSSANSAIRPLEDISGKKLTDEEDITAESQYDALQSRVAPLAGIPYADQIELKQDWVAYVVSQYQSIFDERCKILGRGGHRPNPSLHQLCPSPIIERYRNKDTYVVRPGVDGNPKTVGHIVGHPSKSSKYVCVPPCDILSPSKHIEVAKAFQDYIRGSHLPACLHFQDKGFWKGICVRTNSNGETMAFIDVHPSDLTEVQLQEEQNGIKNFFVNGPGSTCELTSLYFQACPHTRCSSKVAPLNLLHGDSHLIESLYGREFALSPTSFFQINKTMAEVLYHHVLSAAKLTSMSTLLDLCCGIGVVSILASPHVRGSVGVDICDEAIEDAKNNTRRNKIHTAHFVTGRVEVKLSKVLEKLDLSPDIAAVLNPGRGGVYKNVIEAVRKVPQVRTLVYVSCQPDHHYVVENIMKLLIPEGRRVLGKPFRLTKVVPLDMFPQTNHCEVIFCFNR